MAEIIPCGAFYLYRDDKSPFWQVRAEKSPRTPLFKSTRTDNPAIAKRRAKDLYDEWANAKRLSPGDEILFRDLWHEYVEHRASFRPARSTLIRIESVGKNHLIPAFGNKFLSEIPSLWTRFAREKRRTRPGSRLTNERKYLLASLQFAHENGLVDKVPFLKSLEGHESTFKVYSDDEIRRLLAKLDELEKASSARVWRELRLIMLMGFQMGMRVDEICSRLISDVDRKDRMLFVSKTKTKKNRTISIPESIWIRLNEQIERAKPSPFIFPQARNPEQYQSSRYYDGAWQELKTKAKVQGRFHDLRHTCASRLAKSSVPHAVAARYLGMSLRTFDRVYCHLDRHDTAAAAEIVKLETPLLESPRHSTGRGDTTPP